MTFEMIEAPEASGPSPFPFAPFHRSLSSMVRLTCNTLLLHVTVWVDDDGILIGRRFITSDIDQALRLRANIANEGFALSLQVPLERDGTIHEIWPVAEIIETRDSAGQRAHIYVGDREEQRYVDCMLGAEGCDLSSQTTIYKA